MIRDYRIAAALAVAALAGCHAAPQGPPDASASSTAMEVPAAAPQPTASAPLSQPAPTEAVTPQPSPSASSSPAIDPVVASIPESEKGEKAARGVLLSWAHAIENKQFALAWRQFADHGRRSGLSEADYAAQFAKCRRITVAMPTGTSEGAAGSIYYTAPTTLTCELKGGGRELWKGDVILRRVNDVPGATAEQLHWHLESADLKPG